MEEVYSGCFLSNFRLFPAVPNCFLYVYARGFYAFVFQYVRFIHVWTSFGTNMGAKKFLFYYLFTAIGALILQWIVQYIELKTGAHPFSANIPLVGASGAIFGLLAGFGIQYPNAIIQLIIPLFL